MRWCRGSGGNSLGVQSCTALWTNSLIKSGTYEMSPSTQKISEAWHRTTRSVECWRGANDSDGLAFPWYKLQCLTFSFYFIVPFLFGSLAFLFFQGSTPWLTVCCRSHYIYFCSFEPLEFSGTSPHILLLLRSSIFKGYGYERYTIPWCVLTWYVEFLVGVRAP